MLRNVGVPIGHSILAMQSLLKGFGKLLVNKEKVVNELSDNWAVVAEAIQTILRREQYPNPYESLKALTRTHSVMNEEAIHDFIETLNISDSVKSELKAIRPENYLGF